jgi:hypothetical protein
VTSRRRAVLSRIVLSLILSTQLIRLSAHPMPNTEIAIWVEEEGVRLEIALPIPELRLAVPASFPQIGDVHSQAHERALATYLDQHLSIISKDGVRHAHVLESVGMRQSLDTNVGQYQELHLRVWVPARGQFDPRVFTLEYDAIIHQVPNHFAVVKITRDFRGGLLSGEDVVTMGVIRFDFSQNRTPALAITAAPGSIWRGFWSAIALGFRHVTTGLDHILFLLTLLVVAPLRAVNGRWSLFQGWKYAAHRFLAITVAFTLGHSVALMLGAYEIVPVPREVVEITIAASIVTAALHAVRPLFAGREWLVAVAFGIVHGLAFSESLIGLRLTSALKSVAVLGFNIGVEGAQLLALALPLLIISRWRMFHSVRLGAMVCTAVLAAFWMFERAGWATLRVKDLTNREVSSKIALR